LSPSTTRDTTRFDLLITELYFQLWVPFSALFKPTTYPDTDHPSLSIFSRYYPSCPAHLFILTHHFNKSLNKCLEKVENLASLALARLLPATQQSRSRARPRQAFNSPSVVYTVSSSVVTMRNVLVLELLVRLQPFVPYSAI
jgi:hypothetical protein